MNPLDLISHYIGHARGIFGSRGFFSSSERFLPSFSFVQLFSEKSQWSFRGVSGRRYDMAAFYTPASLQMWELAASIWAGVHTITSSNRIIHTLFLSP